ncbi:MAG TPA: TetR/AcrR family transcriptional regulator [Allosphingosinicella sp.]|nr:TetR/AcrR family transcriptional regulator [Allosphingosinicella sp.]
MDDEGGRRRRRKDARPSELVEAARLTFLDKGFAATRVEDIARRAEVSKGTVYLYFPSKEALFEAVVRINVVPIIERMIRVIEADQATPAIDQLKLIGRTMYREMVGTDRKRLLHMVIAEGQHFPWLTEFYHREILSRGMELIRIVLRRGEEKGELRLDGVDEFPQILMAPTIVAAIFSNLFSAYEPIDIDRFADAHIALMERGLRVPKE